MSEFTIVTRDIPLDLPADELWELIGAGEGWKDWMVDEADIDVAPGGGGEVVDDGEVRRVEVTSVRPGESVRFVWWPEGRDELASSVSLTVDADEHGRTVLRVVEVHPPESIVDRVSASITWDVRAAAMWARCSALATV